MSVIANIKEKLKQSKFIYRKYKQFRYSYYKTGTKFISDKNVISKRFRKRLGRDVNLLNPLLYNDKIQWLKLYWRDNDAAVCADKFKVRDFVKKRAGGLILNDIYGVYDNVNDIKMEQLPDSFVLKATHASGFIIICTDKNTMDWDNEFWKMRLWLKINFYHLSREWVYKDIKPRIICEKYLSDDRGNPPLDYKIFCFNGEPRIIQVDIDIFGDHKRNYYDLNWNYIDVELRYKNSKETIIKKPDKLNEMLETAGKLSKGFPHVRVDLYYIEHEQKIIFGELTFFNGSGYEQFRPPEFEAEMGSWLSLSKC